ncbi:replication initiation protein RepC, partial [Rhizobium ruizarguesonis]
GRSITADPPDTVYPCSIREADHAASAILATVLEKSLRDPELIAKPGGYFRAMVDRAVDGSLHLSKSLYGIAESEMNTR